MTQSDERPETSGQRVVATTKEARQAVTGHNVRYVLAVGLASAAVALTLLYLIYFKA